MGVKVTDRLTADGRRFFRELEELRGLQVRIGFQKGDAQEKDGTDICDIAAWNELGTEHIPARPFLRQSVDNHTEEIKAKVGREIKAFARGRKSAQQVLEGVGNFQKKLVQKEIRDGGFAPNAESTIRKKKSSKPLIHTGKMRQSVNYVIKAKGGGDD